MPRSNGQWNVQQLDKVNEVRQALEPMRGHFKQIARASGGMLTYAWMCNFLQGRIREPSILKILVAARFAGLTLQWQRGPSILDAAKQIATDIERDMGLTPGELVAKMEGAARHKPRPRARAKRQ